MALKEHLNFLIFTFIHRGKNILFSVFFISLFVLLLSFQSEATHSGQPLFFPAEKNNVQVLPQKFEFLILDPQRIKIGDILIDSTQLRFQFLPSNRKPGFFRLRFFWPAALFTEGQLTLFNNYGKALYSTPLREGQFKVTSSQRKKDQIRDEVATFTSEELAPELFEELKLLPFVKFCPAHIEATTRIELCSQELYFSKSTEAYSIRPRESSAREAKISINGQSLIGKQGIVSLSNPQENISLRAVAESGASLNVETRMNQVQFRDFILSEDQQNIIITAFGARPVQTEGVEFLENNLWRMQIPREQPLIYLRGQGEIPLKQEFYVRGELPKEENRPRIERKYVTTAYSREIDMEGGTPENTQAMSGEKLSEVTPLQEGKFNWKLKALKKNAVNRRDLQVQSSRGNFVASTWVERGSPFELRTGVNVLAPANTSSFELSFQWWIENFLFQTESWAHLRWGLELSSDALLLKNKNLPGITHQRLALLYRFTPGFHVRDDSMGLKLLSERILVESTAFMPFGIGYFWRLHPTNFLSSWGNAFEMNLHYFSSATANSVKLSSAFKTQFLFQKISDSSRIFSWGLELSQLNVEDAADASKMQAGLTTSYSWLF